MTIRRAPLPADFVPPACDTPPAELGRIARPPHPALGAGFAALLGLGLGFGAITTPGAGAAGLLIACIAASACLAAVMHFGDGTALRHVPAKLAFERPRRRWAIAAAAAIVPVLAMTAFDIARRPLEPRPWSEDPLSIRGLAIVAGATWIEMSARAHAFRGCMGRHGFGIAAAVAIIVSLAAALPWTLVFAVGPLQRGVALALEIPLSLSFAALVLRSESILPILAVRIALLGALVVTGNAFAAAPAALVAWIAAARR